MKRVVIIEDQKLLRELIVHTLVHELRFEVAASTEDGEAGLEACIREKPDLVILDLVLPKLSGLAVLRQLRHRLEDVKVIVLSGNLTPDVVKSVNDHGVNGLFTKDCAVERLTDAIQQVIDGGVYYSPEAFRLLRESTGAVQSSEPSAALTEREKDVLQLVGEGYASKEIADRLCISVRTVEAHRGNIMRKLKLRGATDMARMAVKLNLVAT